MKTKKSLTLAELLMAAVILALACLILFLLFANCIILNERSRSLTTAVSHAQYVMEDIKNNVSSNLHSQISNGRWNWDCANIEEQGLDVLDQETIETQSTVVASGFLDIVVGVAWQDRALRQQNMTLETLIIEQ